MEGGKLLLDFLTSNHVGQAPYGPAAHPTYLTWTRPGNAPLWKRLDPEEDGSAFCERFRVIPDTFRMTPTQETLPAERAAWNLVILCTAATLFTLVYVVSTKYIPVRPVFQTDPATGHWVSPDNRQDRLWVFHWALVYAVVYAGCNRRNDFVLYWQ